MLCLSLVGGADRPDGVKPEFIIHPGQLRCSIGRDPACDWALPDRTLALSARHCEILRSADGWLLRDLSTNGTFVNGSTARMPADHPLRDGDRFDAGPFTMAVRWNPAAAMPTDPVPGASPGAALPRAKSVEDTDSRWTPPAGGRGRDPAAAAAALLPPEPEEDLGMTRIRLAPSRAAGASTLPDAGAAPASLPMSAAGMKAMPVIRPGESLGSVVSGPAPVLPATPAAAPAARVAPDPAPASPGVGVPADLASRMAEGLGLPVHALDGRDAAALAGQLGRVARAAVEALRRLMDEQSRAQRALGSRRPTGAAHATPLRLAGSTDEALMALLSGDPVATFAASCAGLVDHQARLLEAHQATIAALATQLTPAVLAAHLPGADAAQQAALYGALWQRLGVTEGDASWADGLTRAAAQHLASAYDRPGSDRVPAPSAD